MIRLLDLFCGAGGASMGYHRAGFHVTGVDLAPQPRYPFTFIEADALDYVASFGHLYDVIHASPPCQRFSCLATRWGNADTHPDLVGPIRKLLFATGLPYVIENVPGSPLTAPTVLCGSQFANSMLRRHRHFESNLPLTARPCDHSMFTPRFPPLRSDRKGKLASVVGVYGHGGGSAKNCHLWADAMGIYWMTKRELSQAIPPAYTEYIGKQLLDHINEPKEDAA